LNAGKLAQSEIGQQPFFAKVFTFFEKTGGGAACRKWARN